MARVREAGVSDEDEAPLDRPRIPQVAAFAGEDPLLRHVRTRVRSPQTNGVVERFFETLKYEHLYRAPIDDGDALAMEVARFRQIYNTIRPHQALGDQTPRQAYLHAEANQTPAHTRTT